MAAKSKKGKTKSKSVWICSACEAITSGWFGKCPSCGAWNTIEESEPAEAAPVNRAVIAERAKVVPATQAVQSDRDAPRLQSRVRELDRVLGGGLTPGSLVLLGGAPGIGKSTLLLQACAGLARNGHSALYVSGEESVAQVGGRAARLGASVEALSLMSETRIESVLEAAREHKPSVLVVDSIQTVYSEDHEGLPGNVSQIRAVTAQLMSFAKREGVPTFVVGHVTKEGNLAGPRLLEHMVDAVLSFEGDEERSTRLLRATKNRFGSTQELGVFEMSGAGLIGIENPSQAFLSERAANAPGSIVTATIEGSRPLLVEVQALVCASGGGSPRRTCVGAESARLAMILAVLDRHANLFLSDQDVFVNIAGGLRLREPACDLAMLLALASSFRNAALDPEVLALGEVGLTGELRRVPQLEARLREAARLGFTRAVVPKSTKLPRVRGMELVAVRTAREAAEGML